MRTVLVALLSALALLAPAAAGACELTTSQARICPAGSAAGMPCAATTVGGYYVAEDGCPLLAVAFHCHYTFWIYQESNGIDGLQRQDEIVDDTCGGEFGGDSIVF